ncbi:Pectinesterase inhibitor domain [Arabidopsis thaliana x Arabidopsis arenosa]|uniref:Pectinesterase inhibitor domain n=1 Tax=Arabidopsis thaliana x Arabidopsis arenosa TaxID=1240361 RepID=A0A8T2BI99_9BRAS|nr:Pectinesterase inhibitor domain [Arabidopsis thaliana x Arabidopsis arenosa]
MELNKNTIFLVLLLSITIFQSSSATPNRFIVSSCQTTQYPLVCVHTLSAYATKIRHNNDQDLAQTALTISLARAKSVSIFVAKLTKEAPRLKRREYLAIKDCIEVLGNSVDRLAQSVKELGRAGHAVASEDFMWKMSNVQTWVSAALTDETTCLDGFSERAMGGKVKRLIRFRVVHVAQVTSNALALVNQFAEKRSAKFP